MKPQLITLVGRATDLRIQFFESGASLVSFRLTIKSHRYREPLPFRCEAYGIKAAETFERMQEGCLTGIIGTVRPTLPGQPMPAEPLICVERLECLGRPLAAA
jgi:hypothetical protein